MTEAEIDTLALHLAHRTCTQYRHLDPDGVRFRFSESHLKVFVLRLLAAVAEALAIDLTEAPTDAELQAADAEIEAANKLLFPDPFPDQIDDEPPALTLNTAEAGLCREWFDAVQDLNPAYLEQRDYVLAKRLYEALGMRVPHSILGQVTPKPCGNDAACSAEPPLADA